ncbi:MAG TPA: Rieske 2Fe-2S domain-containing protein [Chloroflexota bacterium]|jgi:fatty-acyl-CoA synthase
MAIAERPAIDYDCLIERDRVHGRLYYDPRIFAEELEKIWYREWIYVGHESEVPTPGDYRTRRIGLQPIIMLRGDDGEIRLVANRCSHRGNTLCQTDRGNARAIHCAYHGWAYNSRGELLAVPYASGYGPDFCKADYNLPQVPRVASYRGFIWGSLSPTGISLDEHIGHARKLLDAIVDLSPEGAVEVNAGSNKLRFQANWKMWLENAVDNYHQNVVHPSAFAAQSAVLRKRAAIVSSDASAAVVRDLGRGNAQLDFWPQQRLTGRHYTGAAAPVPAEVAYAEALERRYGKEKATQLLADGPPHVVIFPNFFYFQHDIRVIQPIAPGLSYYYEYPVLLKGVAPELNAQRLRRHEAAYGPAGFVLADDLEMWERNHRALEARLDEWMTLRRGLHREHPDADGLLVSHIADETAMRGIWRHYKALMTRP